MNRRVKFLSIELGRPWTRYVVAAMAVVAAAVLHWMLLRVSGDIPSFPVFFIMVTLVTRFLGGRAGVLAAVLSVFPVHFFLVSSPHAWDLSVRGEALTVGLFCASCLMVVLTTEPLDRIRPVAAKTTEGGYGEDALRRSEERFGIVQELSLDAFAVLSAIRDDQGIIRDFQCEFVNPAAGRLLRHTPEELIGKRLLQILPSIRTRSDLFDRFVDVLQTGVPHDYELYYEGDGLKGWFRNMAVRLGDGVAVCFADITPRKQAEDELRASKERFELAVRGAGVGIWDWDIRTGKVYYSPRWKAIFGYAENEIGEGFDDWARLLHPEEAEYVCQYQADFLAGTGSTVTLEYRLRHKDGLYRWIEAHAIVVRDEHGKACRLVGSHGDITARKQAEQRLHADLGALTRLHEISGRRLREDNTDAVLSEIMEAAVAIAAADRGLLRLIDPVSGSLRIAAQHGHQPRFLEFLASAENSVSVDADAIGRDQRVVVPDVENSPLFRGTRMLLELRTAGVRAMVSTPITRRDGRLLGVLTTQWAAPHAPDDHDLWRIDLLARQTADLIEQKRSQEERAKWTAQLQRSQQLEALGVLAGGIAHDFNNLLEGILGHIEIARLDAEAGQVTKAMDVLREAVGTMDRARALTDQLITFAKGGAPHRKLAKMAPLLRDTASLVLSGSNVSIEWEIEENLWPCNVDRNQLAQALGNILLNARESMPGGGEVHIGARNLPPGFSLPRGLSPGRYVLISIRDEGPGISKDLMERIFDPFFTTKSTGHGLGLTVAHSIIKRHDGCIDVRSDGTKGATFDIYLPVSPDTAVEDDAAKPELSYTAKGSILLMEDDAVVRKVVSRMLQTIGYTVACASRGEEAIELYRKGMVASQPFDLVILDLTVRDGLGGKDTLVELLGLDPCVRAIVSSGYHDDPVMQNPTVHGFLAGLTKPYNLSEMRATLQRVQVGGGISRGQDTII